MPIPNISDDAYSGILRTNVERSVARNDMEVGKVRILLLELVDEIYEDRERVLHAHICEPESRQGRQHDSTSRTPSASRIPRAQPECGPLLTYLCNDSVDNLQAEPSSVLN